MPSQAPKSEPHDLSILYQEREELCAQIEGIKHIMEEAPLRRQEQLENERTTMPAPDGIESMTRELEFYNELLTKGEVQNERRYGAHNVALIVISVITIIAVLCWIVSEVRQSGILNG